MNLHFSIEYAGLVRQLKRVIRTAQRNAGMPILAHVLVSVHGGTYRIMCSDMRIEMSAAGLASNQGDDGAIALPAKHLYDLLCALPRDTGTIEFQLRDDEMLISVGRHSRFALCTLPAEQFPEPKQLGETTVLEVKSSELRRALQQVRHAMGNQDVRYYLNGASLDVADGTITCAATNGHSLAVVHASTSEPVEQPVKAIVPRDGVALLLTLLDNTGTRVRMELSRESLRLQHAGVCLVAACIDGAFPDFSGHTTLHQEHRIEVERDTLIGVVKRVSLQTPKRFGAITLQVQGERLRVYTGHVGAAHGSEDLQAKCHGGDIQVGVQSEHLLAALKAITTAALMIHARLQIPRRAGCNPSRRMEPRDHAVPGWAVETFRNEWGTNGCFPCERS